MHNSKRMDMVACYTSVPARLQKEIITLELYSEALWVEKTWIEGTVG